MAQIIEQMKTPKIELSYKERDNAQFKTLVIRMLTKLVEYSHKIEEKVKAMKSEIKENVQTTNSDRKETGTQINSMDQKEEISNQKKMKKQEFKNMRRGLGTSKATLNVSTSES